MSKYDKFGNKWYYRLVPKEGGFALLDDYTTSYLYQKLIVCILLDNGKRLFTVFKSFVDYAKFILVHKAYGSFYEVILGEFVQKLHFDIDIKLDRLDSGRLQPDQIRDIWLTAVIKVLKERGEEVDISQDIRIYTSHGADKASYHIVSPTIATLNNEEGKLLFDEITKHVDKNILEFIDSSVYSPTQQFRILGSSKPKKNRPKVLSNSWIFQDQEIKHEYKSKTPFEDFVIKLEESLISFTKNCKILRAKLNKNEKARKPNELNSFDLDSKLVKVALDLTAKYDRSFVFSEVKGCFILLKRISPSFCKLCQRIHENQNPYIYIVDDKGDYLFYFSCRRNKDNKFLLLGRISSLIIDHLEVNLSMCNLKIGQIETTESNPTTLDNKDCGLISFDPKLLDLLESRSGVDGAESGGGEDKQKVERLGLSDNVELDYVTPILQVENVLNLVPEPVSELVQEIKELKKVEPVSVQIQLPNINIIREELPQSSPLSSPSAPPSPPALSSLPPPSPTPPLVPPPSSPPPSSSTPPLVLPPSPTPEIKLNEPQNVIKLIFKPPRRKPKTPAEMMLEELQQSKTSQVDNVKETSKNFFIYRTGGLGYVRRKKN